MKMKKFINAPETITDEELAGLGLSYPDIVDVDGHLVVSRDLADADSVICGPMPANDKGDRLAFVWKDGAILELYQEA